MQCKMTDWEIVQMAFDEGSDECRGCEFLGYEYASDTGPDSWCELGNKTGHDPQWCPAYDRIKEEMEDE